LLVDTIAGRISLGTDWASRRSLFLIRRLAIIEV
jgi:hypothetical protein